MIFSCIEIVLRVAQLLQQSTTFLTIL